LLLARRVVFHSTCDAETDYIKQQFKHEVRIVQIPNYVEVPELVERKPEKHFLYIGRINLKKGIDSLIKALALSKEFLRSDFSLKIAGRGTESYIAMLKDLVDNLGLSEKVSFIGQVEGKDKMHLFANAHWTFMPSHTENFGMVVLESLAQNTPVLASTGSPWQDLEAEKIGFWADNTPETLAEKIDEIVTMPPDIYEAYRLRARPFVEERFDILKNIDKWVELYSVV